VKKKTFFKPLQRGTCLPITSALVEAVAKSGNVSLGEARVQLEQEIDLPIWYNDMYQVQVRELENGWTHLNIRRCDGKVIFRDWRHFQAIKNQICGHEREAVELYPAESRLVDTSNKYHLWVAPEGTWLPIGYGARSVANGENAMVNVAQRARS